MITRGTKSIERRKYGIVLCRDMTKWYGGKHTNPPMGYNGVDMTGDKIKKGMDEFASKESMKVKGSISEHLENIHRELSDPKLLFNIIREINNAGVLGEQLNILTLIIKISLRLVSNANPTSSNILVSDATGAGKDHLIKQIADVMLIPENSYFHRTYLSEKVFNYWNPGTKKKDGEGFDNWNGRVVHLEDPDEGTLKAQAFKIRTSGCGWISVVKDGQVLEHEVKGKPVFIVTSLKTTIDIEGLRRWDSISMDTSKELTKSVVRYYLDKAAGVATNEPNRMLREGLKSLKPVSVAIPYLNAISPKLDLLPESLRTQISKLVDYIKASAALHQLQREKDEDGNIVANQFDFEIGRFIFWYLRNLEALPLNKDERTLITFLLKNPGPKTLEYVISNAHIHAKTWYYDHLDEFVEKGLLNITYEWNELAGREIIHIQPGEAFSNKNNMSYFESYVNAFPFPDTDGFKSYVDSDSYKLVNLMADINILIKENGLHEINLNTLRVKQDVASGIKTVQQSKIGESVKRERKDLSSIISEVDSFTYNQQADIKTLYARFGEDAINPLIEHGVLCRNPKTNCYYIRKGE